MPLQCPVIRVDSDTIDILPEQTRRLLVLSCSATKLKDEQPIAAMHRYDGPAFRVVRKWQACQEQSAQIAATDILILSAEFGLIGPNERIPDYDRRMTRERARELAPAVQQALQHQIHNRPYSEVFFNLGQTYQLTLGSVAAALPINTTFARSGIGKRLRQLKTWLYCAAPTR